MKVGCRCAIALVAFSSVTGHATVLLGAQGEIGPSANSGAPNKTAVKCAFDLTGARDVQRRLHGVPATLPEALEFDSPKDFGGISEKEMHLAGATVQAPPQTASRVPIGSEAGEPPFAQSAQQGPPLQSQAAEGPGSILGAVLDVDGAGVPGARITLTNIGASQHHILASGENGEFAFTNLPPGTYSITVDAKDFEPYTSAEFSVSTGQVYELPAIQLSIATQRQMVVVRPTVSTHLET